MIPQLQGHPSILTASYSRHCVFSSSGKKRNKKIAIHAWKLEPVADKAQNGRMDVRILYTEKIYAYFFAKS
jgi:hypothetical protein